MPAIKVLAIGGGGGGGNSTGAWGDGGGGGGGFVYDAAHNVSAGNYLVTVGAGGAAKVAVGRGNPGGDSIFNTITAYGGGGGGNETTHGGNGGCGGGVGQSGVLFTLNPGIGSQGGNGGISVLTGVTTGGGGAGQAGQVGVASTTGGNGGNGTANSISGAAVTYAGGGAGGGSSTVGTRGTGGTGGGGGGLDATVNGTNDLGGGGAGGGTRICGAGGSGIVIIRYLTTDFGTCTGGTKTTDGTDTLHTFLLADSGTDFHVVIKGVISSNNNTFSNVNCISNNRSGLYMQGSGVTSSDYNLFINCNFAYNLYSGIEHSYANYNNFINSNCSNNGDAGILIDALSTGNKIQNCNCSSNSINGILIRKSNNNIINGNFVSMNQQHGIYLKGSYDNCIGGNEVINNGQKTDNTYSEIQLEQFVDGGTTYVTTYNNVSDNRVNNTTATDPKYGIREESSAVDYNIFANNIVTNAQTAQISIQGANSINDNNIPAGASTEEAATITGARVVDTASSSVNYAHGMSKIPTRVSASSASNAAAIGVSTGFYAGGANYCVYRYSTGALVGTSAGLIYYEDTNGTVVGTVTATDGTNVTISWVRTGTPNGVTINFVLEVE